jgi:hypothetical protein
VTTDAPNWKGLGDLLITRRVQLDPEYKNRRKFVAATATGSTDSWYRMINSVETGNRDNYARQTIAAIEVAYQLKPGSLMRSLRTQTLEPAQADQPAADPGTDRAIVEELRAQATSQDKTIGDILVERGLATPDELTLSDQKRRDEMVQDIVNSNLPDDTKNRILLDYVGRRRGAFRARNIPDNFDPNQEGREAL